MSSSYPEQKPLSSPSSRPLAENSLVEEKKPRDRKAVSELPLSAASEQAAMIQRLGSFRSGTSPAAWAGFERKRQEEKKEVTFSADRTTFGSLLGAATETNGRAPLVSVSVPPLPIAPATETYNNTRLKRFNEQVAAKAWDEAQTLLTELLNELRRNFLTAAQVTTLSQALHPLLAERLPDALEGLSAIDATITAARQRAFDAYAAVESAVCAHLDAAAQAAFYAQAATVLLAKGYALPEKDTPPNASAYWQSYEHQVGATSTRSALPLDRETLAIVASLQTQLSLLRTAGDYPCGLYASFLRHIHRLNTRQPARARILQDYFLAQAYPRFLTQLSATLKHWGVSLQRSASQDEKALAVAVPHLEASLKATLDEVRSSACLLQTSGHSRESKQLLHDTRELLADHLEKVTTQAERALASAEEGPKQLLEKEKGRFAAVQNDLTEWRAALDAFAAALPAEDASTPSAEQTSLLTQMETAWRQNEWLSVQQRYQAECKQIAQSQRQGLLAQARPVLNAWRGALAQAQSSLLSRHQQELAVLERELQQKRAQAVFYQRCQQPLAAFLAVFTEQLIALEAGHVLTPPEARQPTLADTLQQNGSLYQQRVQTWLAELQKGLTENTPIKTLLQQSTAQVQALLATVFHAAETALGPAPCAFTVLGLGSYAREAVLPCSDIDFAILVADEAQRDAPYFSALVRLFQAGWRCLPADVLPLDDGDLIFLLGQDKALLHTPEGMVDEHLPRSNDDKRWGNVHSLSARHPRLIACSQTQAEQAQTLLPRYHQALAARFQESIRGRPLHQALAGVCLETLFQRDTGEGLLNSRGPLTPTVSVKERCLRPVELSSLALAVYYQLTAMPALAEVKAEQKSAAVSPASPQDHPLLGNPYAILEALAAQKILHPAFVQDACALLDRSQRARLKLHLAWLTQPRPPQANKDRLLLTASAGFSPDFSVTEKALGLEQGDWQVVAPLREAASLWYSAAPTKAAWDPLQARYQTVYQAAQQHPDRATDADLAVLAQVLAHRQQFDEAFQREQLLELPQGLRERYLQQLSRYLPRAHTPLLRHLHVLPDPSGWRLKSSARAQSWQQALQQLWIADAKEGVKVQLVENQQVVMQYLRPEIAEQFLNEGRLKPKDPRQAGNHRVYPIRVGSDTVFWLKVFPEQPSTEGLVHYLDGVLGCFGTPQGQLLKIYTQDGGGNGYAVYASSHSMGESLEEVLKEQRYEQLEKLSSASWVSALLRVLLTNPEDDKGDDYFLVPAADGRYTLQRIDNERAFFQPFAQKQLQVKSVLYCMDAMVKPLASTPEGQAVLEDFLRLEPLSVVAALLQHFSEAQPHWQKLFSEEDVLLHFRQKAPEMSLPLLMLPEGLEKELLNRLTAMQTVLQLNPHATGLDLLSSVQPELGRHYSAVHNQLPATPSAPHQQTLKRFVAATPKLYHQDAAGRFKTNVAGPMAVSRSMRLATEMDEAMAKAIYAGKRLSPSQAREGFAMWQKQRLPQIFAGLKQPGQDAKAIHARAQAKAQFEQLPLRHKTLLIEKNVIPELKAIAPENQAFILTAMAGTPWHALPLSSFHAVLTDALLLPLLQGAGGHLITLDISGCHRLTPGVLAQIAQHCPQLKHLQANGQHQWKTADTRPLAGLVRLEMEGATQLTELLLGNLPVLTHLSLADAAQLITLGNRGLGITASTQPWRLPKLTALNTQGCRALRTVHLAVDTVDNFQWRLQGCDLLGRAVLEVSTSSSVSDDFLPALAAFQGDAWAQGRLGWCYRNGQGVVKDDKEAVKWYQKAAEQGNAVARYNLGLCYYNGRGVVKNEQEAVKLFQKAADQRYVLAISNLGWCYQSGRGVVKDEKEAVKLYQKAADQGDAQAKANLWVCYAAGQGVLKDDQEAMRWLQKAADQAWVRAQIILGWCYEEGRYVVQDAKESATWYQKTASQKDQEQEAVKNWYRDAAEQGEAWAQNILGMCYKNGRGVEKDEAEAAKWYLRAANQGDMWAQFNLGTCYANGEGVVKDDKEALRWWQKAAEQGHAGARNHVEKLSASALLGLQREGFLANSATKIVAPKAEEGSPMEYKK